MKLTKKLLHKVCKGKLHLARFLNVSGLELVTLENVSECEAVHWLIASKNRLQSDDGLENLKQLWYLDLSNNQMTMLGTLSRYLALGTLMLSNNNLKWVDLEKIRHAHIMSISLHGNPNLDSDPYYRIHAIDCLPLIWELDGRLVTVTERLHVKQFFIDTELSAHPVRHKMGKTFRTSAIKNIGTEGIVSKQCKYIYSKFPSSETHTKHTDERRLAYLTHMVEVDIKQFANEENKGNQVRPLECSLEDLLDQRHKDTERCNMVLLLLVISLEFQLPTALMRSVLNATGLDMIGFVHTMPFFLLPASHRIRVICVLLNAAKIQRDSHKDNTGGLYPQLFMCLYHTVAKQVRISQTSEANMHRIKPIPMNSDYKALMAGEVVSLMLNVSRFYHYLNYDAGVLSMTVCATGNPEVVDKIAEILYEAEDIFAVMTVRTAHRKVNNLIMENIHERLNRINIKMAEIPIGDRYLSLSDSLPIKPLHSVIWASEFLTNGHCVPRLDPPILYPAREAAKPKPQQPEIRDKVLLGPQVVGEITMILDGEIGLIKVDAVPLPNGAVESRLKYNDGHFTYVDLKAMCFSRDIQMWKPIRTAGDKNSIHTSDLVAVIKKETLKNEPDPTQPPLYSPRTKTLMLYAPGAIQKIEQIPASSINPQPDRRAMSAGTMNVNANFALQYSKILESAATTQENDLNHHKNEQLSILARSKSDPDILTSLPHSALPAEVSENKTSVTQALSGILSQDYLAPLPSRSGSPAGNSLSNTSPRACIKKSTTDETLAVLNKTTAATAAETSGNRWQDETKKETADDQILDETSNDTANDQILEEVRDETADDRDLNEARIKTTDDRVLNEASIETADDRVLNESRIETADDRDLNEARIETADDRDLNETRIETADDRVLNEARIETADDRDLNESRIETANDRDLNKARIKTTDDRVLNEARIETADDRDLNEARIVTADDRDLNEARVETADGRILNKAIIETADTQARDEVVTETYDHQNNTSLLGTTDNRHKNTIDEPNERRQDTPSAEIMVHQENKANVRTADSHLQVQTASKHRVPASQDEEDEFRKADCLRQQKIVIYEAGFHGSLRQQEDDIGKSILEQAREVQLPQEENPPAADNSSFLGYSTLVADQETEAEIKTAPEIASPHSDAAIGEMVPSEAGSIRVVVTAHQEPRTTPIKEVVPWNQTGGEKMFEQSEETSSSPASLLQPGPKQQHGRAEERNTFLTDVHGQREGLQPELFSKQTEAVVATSAGKIHQYSSERVTRRPKTSKSLRRQSPEVEGSKATRQTHSPSLTHLTLGGTDTAYLAHLQTEVLKTSSWSHMADKREITKNQMQRGILGPAVFIKTGKTPPQRPTSPTNGVSRVSTRMQATKMKASGSWLGGGRDLYWEGVRKRPKSGHVAGWKEGLPASMRSKQRSKSAILTRGSLDVEGIIQDRNLNIGPDVYSQHLRSWTNTYIQTGKPESVSLNSNNLHALLQLYNEPEISDC